ncbi:MAG: hemerythrin domain-containing protein [Dehalococcoidales bacterium]
MKPIGPLMREHRLIERMVKQLEAELGRINASQRCEPSFIDIAVDFFRIYADRTHHGKEEDILFAALARKRLAKEHRETMEGLIADHVFARKTVGRLVAAKEKYVSGSTASMADITDCITELVKLYPRHIEKEDEHFFYPSMEYFNRREQDEMLDRFWEFDRTMVHTKYQKVLADLEEGRA